MAQVTENLNAGERIKITPDELRMILQAHFRAFVSEVGVKDGKIEIVFSGKAPNSLRPS